MKPEKTYQYLEDLAEQLGISIRYDDFSDPEMPTRSGLCKVKGHHFYFMDNSKSIHEKIRLLSKCLSRMDLEGVFVLPAVRDLLGRTHNNNKTKNFPEDQL